MGKEAQAIAFARLPVILATEVSSGTIAMQPITPFSLGTESMGKVQTLLSKWEEQYSRLILRFLFDWFKSENGSFLLLEVSVIDECDRN